MNPQSLSLLVLMFAIKGDPYWFVSVGCKADLPERRITLQEAEAKYGPQHVPVFETSAKTGAGLEAAFMSVLKKVRC